MHAFKIADYFHTHRMVWRARTAAQYKQSVRQLDVHRQHVASCDGYLGATDVKQARFLRAALCLHIIGHLEPCMTEIYLHF